MKDKWRRLVAKKIFEKFVLGSRGEQDRPASPEFDGFRFESSLNRAYTNADP